MPPGDHNPPGILTKPGEFAPGIPVSRVIKPLPRVRGPQEWGMALQRHEAERAGTHSDLRLVDEKGRAHSWALPNIDLPKPGEKVTVIQQPTHTKEYAAKKGPFLIPEGYGKGKVTGSGLKPVEVVSRRPGVLRFNVYEGRGAQEYALVDTPTGQLLHNFTTTKETGVRGAGGHDIPQSKPKYREQRPETIRFDDDREIHQAKLDGAHVTFHLPSAGKQIRAFSYRPTERATGVLEHTHKLPGFRELRAPPGLAGTVLRGELWAADRRGKALPAERLGGMLNASVPKSRELQQTYGQLRATPFDVVRYKGRNVEDAPYSKKLNILKEVEKKVPFLKMPPMATTAKEKERLFGRIQAGKLKETKEGVVAWPLEGGRPTKIKLRPDIDAEVMGVFPGKGKHEGRAGGLLVRTSKDAPVTRVGTGFSDKQREQLWKDRENIEGRVAKVEAQQVFPSGKLRAPSFKEFHIEKGKQASIRIDGFLNELKKIGGHVGF
jgi:hypothetical protein